MKLSLILSTYNQCDALARVFQGLARQTRWPAEILIADDGSTQTTRDLIDAWRPTAAVPVQHHWHPDNGFLKTTILNKAVAAATGDYLVFLDGDCVPHQQFIADHERLAERGYWVQGRRCYVREPFVAAFQPGKTPVWLWAWRRRIAQPQKMIRLPWPLILRNQKQRGILGCNLACWREDVLRVNGFDEVYHGRALGADSDLGTRLYHLGCRRKFVYGRALVYHLDHERMPRPHFAENQARHRDVLRTGKVRCDRGVDQYLTPR